MTDKISDERLAEISSLTPSHYAWLGLGEVGKAHAAECISIARELLAARKALAWQPIETAPKDGTRIWVWLYYSGIRQVYWETAGQYAERIGDPHPDKFTDCWTEIMDDEETWCPLYWLPLEAIPAPPGAPS